LSPQEFLGRCEAIVSAVSSSQIAASVTPTRSVIGGGTTPGARLKSFAVALRHGSLSARALATALRGFNPPVVARVHRERLLLDLRTVEPEMDAALIGLLRSLIA
jgi:L-seryl-tRNA(Ser) seleniumtransferase